MKSIINEIVIKKMEYNGVKVKKWYNNDVIVFSAGNVVTYNVDTGITYQEEVDIEASCLSPKTFSPQKIGYDFLGWREDSDASSNVLSEKNMGDNPITLYAVFQKKLTAYFNGNGATSGSNENISAMQYYNNGNIVNPVITLPANGYNRTGYRFNGWNYGAVGEKITIVSDITVLAQWVAINYVVTYIIAGAVYKETRTIGQDCLNPSTFAEMVDGATFQGWSETAGVASILTSKTMGTSDITLYAVYQYSNYLIDGTGTINAEAAEHTSNGFIRYLDGAKYSAITFSYDVGVWSGSGGSWLRVKNAAGTNLFEATNEKNYQGTGNVSLPYPEMCTIEGHCWQDDEGGARCRIDNATVYGRQCVG